MADVFSRKKRSWVMSRVRSKDTVPEKAVRSYLHRLGYRFRLHVASLPGKPDIVLPKHRTVVFVHEHCGQNPIFVSQSDLTIRLIICYNHGMRKVETISKASFARELAISKARVSQLLAMGMPIGLDGRLNRRVARAWYCANIATPPIKKGELNRTLDVFEP